jgi:hypothetical protein
MKIYRAMLPAIMATGMYLSMWSANGQYSKQARQLEWVAAITFLKDER